MRPEITSEACTCRGTNAVVSQSTYAFQTLYKTKGGRYVVTYLGNADLISPADAARWLLTAGYDLPHDLRKYADDTTVVA